MHGFERMCAFKWIWAHACALLLCAAWIWAKAWEAGCGVLEVAESFCVLSTGTDEWVLCEKNVRSPADHFWSRRWAPFLCIFGRAFFAAPWKTHVFWRPSWGIFGCLFFNRQSSLAAWFKIEQDFPSNTSQKRTTQITPVACKWRFLREQQSAATDSPLWISQERADRSRTSSLETVETAARIATTVLCS